MDEEYFYSLVRKPSQKKMRKCLRCKTLIFGFARLCAKCADWMTRQSVHCGDMCV